MKTEEGKSIKDYLHLYLGIDVQMDGETIGKLLGYSVRNLDEDEIMIMYTVQMGEEEDDWAVYNDDEKTQRIKPLLRPLSDMTEKEAWDGWRFVTDPHYYHVSNPKYALEHGELNISTSEWANVVRWLLSKHFDLFGLIKSGLAIDKTKTKSQ